MSPVPILFAACGTLGVLLLPGPCRAGTEAIHLVPPGTQVEFTTYAMGLFPLEGHYDRFTGELRVDPARPADCRVTLDVDVGSLVMADPSRVRLALGPKLLDQGAYPHLLYAGTCGGGHATGVLTMHGVSKPVDLMTRRDGPLVTAQGSLHRQDFGIDGLPGLIGARITITFLVRLPMEVARLVDP